MFKNLLGAVRAGGLTVALWIAGQGRRGKQPLPCKAGSQDHSQRVEVIGRKLLMVISKGKEIKIYSLAFPKTALVLRDRKKKKSL